MSPGLALFALALASFGIGTTEFVIMGLLPDVARDLAVTIPQAGLLVSGYALSVAFGSPFLAIATARMDRRRALLVLMAVFTLGNALCALAPNYALLMVARVVTALCHGAFFGLGSVVATTLVGPEKRGRAIAAMFAGLTVANVLGVPFGTAVGEAMGWRPTFWIVAGFGVLAAGALHRWLPRHLPGAAIAFAREARSLANRQVVLAMAISVLASASLFSSFTYIAPLLQTVTGLAPRMVTWMLLLFGLGLTLGNVVGGRLGDWKLMPSVIAVLALLLPTLALFTLTSASAWPAAATIFVWGVLVFALVSPLQMRVVNEAAHAPNLASTLNQGAFNFGNATGAWVGGLALTHHVEYRQLPWVSAAIALAALGLAALSHRIDLARPGRTFSLGQARSAT
ncbi:MAG TPA: MFS transporter [Burkholderiaceae bacterium]|nr:MFS transporter [Burkholderiaceae bacterium]